MTGEIITAAPMFLTATRPLSRSGGTQSTPRLRGGNRALQNPPRDICLREKKRQNGEEEKNVLCWDHLRKSVGLKWNNWSAISFDPSFLQLKQS
ncbi:hypothetical protein CEXT_66051 [Caerostris extrusa]|uniref:Ycf15 n=1 Tax=Caerostris extrusa TaxID=172846 RepID=A0AAV4M882_CAEEX|nr:hypothetical protein CEXT_66051 [Caerostris extrusa]